MQTSRGSGLSRLQLVVVGRRLVGRANGRAVRSDRQGNRDIRPPVVNRKNSGQNTSSGCIPEKLGRDGLATPAAVQRMVENRTGVHTSFAVGRSACYHPPDIFRR